MKIEWIGDNQPMIFMTPEVQRDMEILCEEAGTDEVGWLGCVSRDVELNSFLVYKILPLPKQEVHSTTTEITPEGLADWMMELLESGELTSEEANDIRFWGHSHVNMGVTPSGQDASQMTALTANLKEEDAVNRFFIRCITNKRGDYNFAIFQYDLGIALTEADWRLIMEHPDDRVAYWKKQIEEKVTEIRTVSKIGYNQYRGYQGKYPQQGGGIYQGNFFEDPWDYGYPGYGNDYAQPSVKDNQTKDHKVKTKKYKFQK